MLNWSDSFVTSHRILAWICLLISVSAEPLRFDGYKVFRVKVQTSHDVSIIDKIQLTDKYDVWNYPSDIMTAPSDAEELEQLLHENGLEFDVWIDNVQNLVDHQFKGGHSTSQRGRRTERSINNVGPAVHDFDYSVYHRYTEIDQWIKDTAAKFPNLTEEFIIGKSYEQRVMRALKVGAPSESKKPVMWVHSGIHAREWVTPATNMWMTNQMLMEYGNDTVITRLLNDYDLYILFSMNPDGYDFTWDENRLWRKTRSPNMGSTCVGTDPNRNWNYEWGGLGVSFNPCSTIYCGSYPHSEIEVKNVIDFLQTLSQTHEIKFFMDIHSYSQLFLNPWGYTRDRPTDYDEHMEVGEAFADAAKAVHGKIYEPGSIPDVLSPASGSSLDFGYGKLKIKFSHGLELRDLGQYGFVLPEEQILPTAEETYAGMKAVYDYVMQHV